MFAGENGLQINLDENHLGCIRLIQGDINRWPSNSISSPRDAMSQGTHGVSGTIPYWQSQYHGKFISWTGA